MINRVGRARSETGYLPTHHTHNLQVRCPSTGLRLSPGFSPNGPDFTYTCRIEHQAGFDFFEVLRHHVGDLYIGQLPPQMRDAARRLRDEGEAQLPTRPDLSA